MLYLAYFLDSRSVLGWVGFHYVRAIRFYLSYTRTVVWTFVAVSYTHLTLPTNREV